jgi:hypothetical protein
MRDFLINIYCFIGADFAISGFLMPRIAARMNRVVLQRDIKAKLYQKSAP